VRGPVHHDDVVVGEKLSALVRIGKSTLVPVRCRQIALAKRGLTAQRQVAIERFVPARIRMDENGTVLFDHQQSGRLRQKGVQTAGVGDLAASNDRAHRANLPSLSDRTEEGC
jgi:hypothetical protein